MNTPPRSPPDAVPFVHDPTRATSPGPRALGGKGAALCALSERGFPVPTFFCVTTRVLDEVRETFRDELEGRLRRLGELRAADPELDATVRAVSELAREALMGEGLREPARAAVERGFDRLFDSETEVAIRSSVVGEDSTRDSFAGQMSTYLFVRREELHERIRDCLASAFSERAIRYRHARGLLDRPIEAGVVVQEMIRAEKSGVAFTADPVSGDPSVLVVTAGYGLGEGVVGDLVEVDTFRIDKTDPGVVRRDIVSKTRRLARDAAPPGTRVESVPGPLRDEPVLSDDELRVLTELAGRVEAAAGAACDLEWSLDRGGRLWLLQSRPLTTGTDRRVTILDNSNIIESYPGISSPLTFSFVRRGYAATFREGMRMLGVSEAALEAEETLFQNLIAYVEGRIYYNILHWYRLYDLLGLEAGIPAWERALGLSGGGRQEFRTTRPGLWRRAYIRWRMARGLFTRGTHVRAYLELLRREEDRVRAMDLGALSAHELLELLEELTDRLLAPYGISVVNDLFAQQLYDRVGKLIGSWEIGEPARLRNALVVGPLQSDAVLPVRSLTALAREVRGHEAWRRLFESVSDPDELWDRIRRRPELSGLRARLEDHVSRYGDRTMEELKLETPSLRDDPAFALHHLRGYVLSPPTDSATDPARLSREAEAEVRAALRLRPLRRFFFFRLLGRAREAIRYRESLRLARSRAFGLVKRIYGALGGRFQRHGLLAERDDVFFLTADEIEGAVRGHSVTGDLRALASLRREELARFEAQEDPPARMVVHGPVHRVASDRWDGSTTADEGEELRGHGCSPGVATGPALVVREPRRRLDASGRILIAPATDPGWVFLMVVARGLVVERGSVLSHTAIVGRELGIPTVVGVRDATRRIREGDLVHIDGTSGVVRVEAAAPSDAAARDPGGSL